MSLFEIQDEIRKAVDKEQLQEWLRLEPRHVYRDLAFDWSAIIAAFLAVSLLPTWWMFVICFFVIGFNQYALFIIGHDGIHSCVHPDRTINDLICKWFVLGPMCMGFQDAKRNHLEHHKLMGTAEDPDRYLHIISNKNSPFELALYCSGLATFGKTVLKVTPIGRVMRSRVCADGAVSVSPRQLLFEYAKERVPVMIMVPLIIAFIMLLHLPWWCFFTMWILPIYVCVFAADEIRAFCDHAVPVMPDELADQFRLVTFVPCVAETIIFAPHNMNYHAEHHLWPRIPYYKRKRAFMAVKSNSHITYRKSYIGFMLELFCLLPLKETEEVVSNSVASSSV